MKRNFIYNFLLTGSNLLFPLLTFPYLSRKLGVEGLGICNFIISYGQNFMIFAALGLPVYGIREIAKVGDDVKKRSKIFFELLSTHLIFTFFFLAIYIASIFLYTDFKNYKELALLGGSLILFNVFTVEWLFSGVNDFKYITLRTLFIRALSVISIFVFVKQKTDFSIYFIILVLTAFFTILVDLSHARKFLTRDFHFSLKNISLHIKSLFILGFYMVLTSVYAVLPTTLLGFLSTKSAVGYYYGANRIVRMVISFFSALTSVMIPRLNRILEENGKDEYFAFLAKSLNIVISFGIPITFFIFLNASPVILLLAGKNFFNSIYVVQVMSPVILFVAFAQVFVLLILSVNRKDALMVLLSITGMVVSLIINLVFIHRFAEKATAFSQLIAEFLVTILSFYLSKRIVNFSFPLKKFLLNILLVIPFALFSYVAIKLFNSNILILLFSGMLCSIYFVLYQLYIIKDELMIVTMSAFFERLKKRSLA